MTTRNNVGNICIISHAPKSFALRTNVFSNVTRQLLVTNKGQSAFHCTKPCQGQMKTPQSLTVLDFNCFH